jgi:hypothetical protein
LDYKNKELPDEPLFDMPSIGILYPYGDHKKKYLEGMISDFYSQGDKDFVDWAKDWVKDIPPETPLVPIIMAIGAVDKETNSIAVRIYLDRNRTEIKNDIDHLLDILDKQQDTRRMKLRNRLDKSNLYFQCLNLKKKGMGSWKIGKEVFPDDDPKNAKNKVENLLRTMEKKLNVDGVK